MLTREAPCSPKVVDSIPSSNIIHVSVERIDQKLSDGEVSTGILLASGADKSLHTLSPHAPFKAAALQLPMSDSPTLSTLVLRRRYVISASMSGRVALYDAKTQETVEERRDHMKYVVRIASFEDSNGAWVATAGWDAKINLYRLDVSPESVQERPTLGEPVASFTLPTNPHAILFLKREDLHQPMLILSRHDSTFLYYYALPEQNQASSDSLGPSLPLQYLGRQNLAPYSNAWIGFTPAALALHPTDPSLLAIATSHTPYMKLIIARLLMPPPSPSTSASASEIDAPPPTMDPNTAANPTQASQARALLMIQDREAAAIQVQMSTLAPQTAYSTPALAWRPDGTGVWVNGDDGVIRGVEAKTGKVVAMLKDGHEAGSKVRCLWAGMSEDEELVVSGGFDRKLIVWQTEAV